MSCAANKTYLEALALSKEHHPQDPNPEGFTNYNAAAVSDNVLIRQNNLIIELLIKISDKIDILSEKLAKGKQKEEYNIREDINKLISGVEGIDINKRTVKNYSRPKFGDGFK